MNTSKWTIAILLASACAMPGMAQTVMADKQLAKKVEAAVQRHEPVSCDSELTPQEYIEAEEELSHIRSVQDSNATFETYSYLLNPNYRRGLHATSTISKQPAQAESDQSLPAVQVNLPKAPQKAASHSRQFKSLGKQWQEKKQATKKGTCQVPPQPKDKPAKRPVITGGYHSPNSIWAKKVGL